MPRQSKYQLDFFGSLSARAETGESIEISSARGQAILGILATARRYEKDRRLLQDLLWYDRGAEQAQSSLRQEIARLRKAFGNPEIILTLGTKLRLNTDLVAFQLTPPNQDHKAAVQPEFLEGVDITGPFENWIRDIRQELTNAPRSMGVRPVERDDNKTLRLHFTSSANSVTGDIFLDRVARSISDVARIEINRSSAMDEVGEKPDLIVQQGVSRNDNTLLLRHAILMSNSANTRWTSEWVGAANDPMQEDILRESFQTQQAIIDTLTQLNSKDHATLIGLQAIQDAFSLDPEKVRRADIAFKHALDISPHPAYLAWRGFILTNQVIERQVNDAAGAADEAISLVWQAIQQAPDNAAVLAIAAHVLRVMDEKPDLAAEFGYDALRLNPTNPLAWSSTANALISLNLAEKAAPLAERALNITRNSPFRFWWEMNACVASVVNNDERSGLVHAELAHRLKPDFRPPLRYMTALYLAQERAEAALTAAQKLQRLEPDFEIRLLHEPEYPAGTLRQSGTYARIRQFDLPELNQT